MVASEPQNVQDRVWQRVTDEAWDPYVDADGRVRLTNLAHIVSATNPDR